MADAPRIKLGRDGRRTVHVDIPKLVDTRMLVQANSGGGKSYAVRVLAEQAMHHVQTIVLDPDGEFASLREIHDVLLVGADGDLPADVRGASLLARRLAEKGCSSVIDLYELSVSDKAHFVKDFCNALLKIPKGQFHPMLVFLDEAPDFCPERGIGQSVATEAVISLMARGRKRGIGMCLAAQRMSQLHKTATAQANNYLLGRTAQDTDRKRVAQDLGLEKADRDRLRRLEPGQFWAFGPAFSHTDVRLIKIGDAQTTHPESGTALNEPPPPSKRIRSLIQKDFADLPSQAREEASTLKEAQAAVVRLTRENTRLQREGTKGNAQELASVRKELAVVRGELATLTRTAEGVVGDIEKATSRLAARSRSAAPAVPSPAPAVTRARHTEPPKPAAAPPRRPSSGLTRSEQAIVDGLAWLEAAGIEQPTRVQLAWAAHSSPRSSGYEKRLGQMKGAGWISYPLSGHVALTDEGRGAAVPPLAPPSSEELQNMICEKLPPRHVRIVRTLASRYPEDYARDECAEAMGVSPKSSGFEKDLGSLRGLGVLTYPSQGRVRGADVLFL